MSAKSVRSAGEFALIEKITAAVAARKDRGLAVDIGDDAFAARPGRGKLMVSTVDMLVEDVHFRRDWTTARDLGYKAMAVNLSDLAAMGACLPRYALVALALPGDTGVDFVDKLYSGMNAISGKYGLRIAGGDTVSSKKGIVISISLIGEVDKRYIVTRSGARPGDLIFVTGSFGDSGAGLYLLKKGVTKGCLVGKHRLPEPRFDASFPLARTGKVSAMIDSSDGLAASVRIIAHASGTGAEVDLDRVPLSKDMKELARRDACVDPVYLALNGGEDYELVFTGAPEHLPLFKRLVPDCLPVGRITRNKDIRYLLGGKPAAVRSEGYEHFT